MSKEIVDVGMRLSDPGSRRDLAWEVIAVMLHPTDIDAQRRRQSAGAEALLAMRDGKTDEKEVRDRASARWRKMGGVKTASEAYPYYLQQVAALRLVPNLLMVGDILGYVWAMAFHHETVLAGGASISKAITVWRAAADSAISERTLWGAWMRYAPVAHLCAAFAFRYHQADPGCVDECMKTAFDEELPDTLAIAASFQQFGIGFLSHGASQPLLDPEDTWMLGGIEPDDRFLPPPLPPLLIAAAQKHQARRNVAYPR